MKRTIYRGYVIDTDSLGRLYLYNSASPYSEDSDHILVGASTLAQAKALVDARVETGQDVRNYTELGKEG